MNDVSERSRITLHHCYLTYILKIEKKIVNKI